MLNYDKLVTQGRAKAYGKPWSPEELDFLISLEKDRKLRREVAADYIRNGIKTLEGYDKAVAKDFEPLNIDEAKAEAEKAIEARGEAIEKKTGDEVEKKKKAVKKTKK